MKKSLLIVSLLSLPVWLLVSCQSGNETSDNENQEMSGPVELNNAIDSLSYSLGVSIGGSFRN